MNIEKYPQYELYKFTKKLYEIKDKLALLIAILDVFWVQLLIDVIIVLIYIPLNGFMKN